MPRGTQPRMRSRQIAALVLGVALGACEGEATVATANVRDSLGIRIVEHPAALDLPLWTLEAEPEALIGRVDDADPAQQFSQIRGAVRLSDGRIVVGDWGSREARYYDASGTALTSTPLDSTDRGNTRRVVLSLELTKNGQVVRMRTGLYMRNM